MSDTTQRDRNDEARRAMLAAIRARLAESAPFDAARKPHSLAGEDERDEEESHERAGARSEVDASALAKDFCRALESVGGHCLMVNDEKQAADAVREIIVQTDARRVALSDSPLVRRIIGQIRDYWESMSDKGAELSERQRIHQSSGSRLRFATNSRAKFIERADAAALFGADIGITSAQWAIAETGTLVLESETERHRLASLVPPIHVALMSANQIRRTLGEVLHSLNKRSGDGLSRAVTFITGQSRTSDIELTLALGVHGPGELHVVVIAPVESVEGAKS